MRGCSLRPVARDEAGLLVADAGPLGRAGDERDGVGAPGALLSIISGPSGVGKDTIIESLRGRPATRDAHYVITCTTRAPRQGEVPGVSYHFLDRDEFAAMRAAGGFLEANEVHGNWYGTPRRQVAEALAAGRDVMLKI